MADWLSLTEAALPQHLPDRHVAVRAGRPITHAQFAHDVGCWQAAFAERSGTSVAIHAGDGYAFATMLFGAWHAGKVAVLPGDAQPATLERLLPQVDACAGELPGGLAPARVPAPDRRPLDPRETRTVIYTSGSSGQPLAIQKRLAQLDAEVRHLEAVFGPRLDAHGPALVHGTVSHQHIYGLLFLTLWPLAAGRAVAVEKLAYPEQIAQRLGMHSSVLVSSPAHLRRLPDTLDWSHARVGLRAIFSSGGPLPPEAAGQADLLLGQSPIEVYGSSETGGIAWRQRALDGDAWRPLPAVRWRLQDGTLCVHSPHLDGDDWWETSDRASALPDGRFVLQGRADRIVKIEEKRLSLVALEEALVAGGLVAETKALLVGGPAAPRLAVVAVPSPAGWAQLHAGGKRALNDRLREQLSRTFERVVLPRRFRYVPELPVNTQGKATDALLAALFLDHLPRAQWHQRDAMQATVTLEVAPDLRVFEGHFPGAPVLPGVAQLDWAITFARQAFPVPPRFLRAEQLKFQRAIVPPLALALRLDWDAAAGHLAFRYESEEGLHSGGRIVFGAADA